MKNVGDITTTIAIMTTIYKKIVESQSIQCKELKHIITSIQSRLQSTKINKIFQTNQKPVAINQ
ncbi:hypothetical protein DERP_012686 [Dermatophagoides pteronyssinus]|uniref:Uncharacterized protein n=1 Tax=Dermatophagoides pteronyssinus TaxID=6956 RepID=A0ABQ8IYK7_DERPT|nr:hypothetical protein DERP_012686 [Dermatophagoides pteronyssinus]